MFRCLIGEGSKGWRVNGTFIDSVPSNPDIEESSYSPDLGLSLHTLVIVARGVYNGTTVQCAVLSFTSATEYSSIAVLLIQGIVTLLQFELLSKCSF